MLRADNNLASVGAAAMAFGLLTGTLLARGATLPDPATWATLVFGFGVVGGAVRRRPSRLAHA